MSLNWNITRVVNMETTCYERLTAAEIEAMGTTVETLVNDHGSPWYIPGESETEKLANCDVVQRLNPLTNCLIWATMGIGMGRITEESYGEFWLRMNMIERLNGPYLSKRTADGESWEPRSVTLEEVKAHIGLGTNVSHESWTSWTKRQIDSWRSNGLRGAGLEAGPWNPPVSQVAKDTGEQIERLANALKNAEIYGDSAIEKKGEAQVEADLERIYRMEDHVRCMESDWEEIESDIEEAEEAEGEE